MAGYISLTDLPAISKSLLTYSHYLGGKLLNLQDDAFIATGHFTAMGREFRAFYHSYQALYPKIENTSFLSHSCLAMIKHISDDITTLCHDVDEEVTLFERQDSVATQLHIRVVWGCWAVGGDKSNTMDRNNRILRFIKEKNMTVRRSQLRYAELLLKLVLAVTM